MAKSKKDDNPQGIKNVEETLTKTEQFLEQNYKPLLIGLVVLVVLVGLSRIYLGVHFPGDVLFGAFMGAILGFFFSKLAIKVINKSEKK